MFKFNFNVEYSEEEECKDINTDHKAEETLEWYQAEEVCSDESKHLSNIGLFKLNSTYLRISDIKLYHVQYEKQIKCLENHIKEIQSSNSNHSDLLTAVYEGGAKIWECTIDLLNYMVTQNVVNNLDKKFVLDLGCGAGLLGIVAAMNGATVHFQDYNKDVIDIITIPNYLINISPESSRNAKTKFFSGDWSKFAELTKNLTKFDLILTSETIYNPHNQLKLLNTFAEKLKADGIILLAAKTYYFGVGGGLRQFEDLIEMDKRFQSKVLFTSNVGVCREIIEIKFKT